MIFRIEVYSRILDTRADARKKWLAGLGFAGKITQLWVVDVYTIKKALNLSQIKKVAAILTNPVTQNFRIISTDLKLTQTPLDRFNFCLETGFLPGVTDNVAATTKEIIEDLLKVKFVNQELIVTSQMTVIKGSLLAKDAESIAINLINPLIQRVSIKNFVDFQKDQGMDISVPEVRIDHEPQVVEVNLNVSDEELVLIGKDGIVSPGGGRRGPLALDLSYMKAIQAYFSNLGRNPTDIELESIAQTWSEHCKHTIFSSPINDISQGLFKKYIRQTTERIRKAKGKRDICVSVFNDNSGAIVFDNEYLITHKVETHNTPSALDPFGGAITGIVGVNRDAIGFGLGAKPIVNTYGFCFANPSDVSKLYKGKDLTQEMLLPKRIIEGVIAGVNSGGNCSGIPTPQGFMYFDDRFRGKPLVFVGTVGLIPRRVNGLPSYIKKAEPGDLIVVVGGRVGIDGIHGATFSSEAMESGSPVTAVQIGDPITQKKFSDALIKEARDLGMYHSITDNGAGGLSSSVSEMAKESGGCEVELERVPLKYPGLDPWQIWISESQERMTLAVPKNKWLGFSRLMNKRGVEATVIGQFSNSGKCIVKVKGRKVVNLDMDFLHEGLPVRNLTPGHQRLLQHDPLIKQTDKLTPIFLKMLSRLNIGSFEFVSNQFDHEVLGSSVLKPLQGRGRINSEATVIRPLLSSQKGVVLSQGIYPSYSKINTYDMAACTIDTAIRNAITVGADLNHLALLDNFCWCSSTESNRLGQLRRAARACYETAVFFGTPFISGKDSMFNDFKGYDSQNNPIKISIPPTLLISSIGIIDDITKVISLDAKQAGDLIYCLGESHAELGGSEYYQMQVEKRRQKNIGNRLPRVSVYKNLMTYKAYQKCVDKGLIASAISVTRGGLGVALAKMALGGLLGFEISLNNLEGEAYRDDFALFSESQGRILVTIAPSKRKLFEQTLADVSISLLGQVTASDKLIIEGRSGKVVVETTLDKTLAMYRLPFAGY